MKIFDSHVHLFKLRIVENVSRRRALAERLDLQTRGASQRLGIDPLVRSLAKNGVGSGLLLPTAAAMEVARTNDHFLEVVAGSKPLHTAGTLHPDAPDLAAEIDGLCQRGVRAIKLCSFSQGFILDGVPAAKLFASIQHHNETCPRPFFVVLDTLYQAHRWFGTPAAHNTHPALLHSLAQRYPAVDFVGAHMGGLAAPWEELQRHLKPEGNLYLDTSNAAHTLSREEFVRLLERFGPHRILFGTDWPWFVHGGEIELIQDLTDAAGFGADEKQAVFHDNIARLMGLG